MASDLRRNIRSVCLLCATSVCAHADPAHHVTARELTILPLMDEGYTAKAIAEELGLSPATVKVLISRLYQKLPRADQRTTSRHAATTWWRKHPELHPIAKEMGEALKRRNKKEGLKGESL